MSLHYPIMCKPLILIPKTLYSVNEFEFLVVQD
uniref:Uncharacterized protein n=1 Tax=Rhizophora mucronata TaxID=61149 RepID=A0A2P2QLX9_RHIMU